MALYKTILMAADLVAADDHPVVNKTKAIQELTGASIILCHVFAASAKMRRSGESFSLTDVEHEIEESAKARLNKICLELGISQESCYLMTGKPTQVILQLADQVNADLIIMGSHARHGLGLLLIGSTTNGVIHHAKCDVLAIRV